MDHLQVSRNLIFSSFPVKTMKLELYMTRTSLDCHCVKNDESLLWTAGIGEWKLKQSKIY